MSLFNLLLQRNKIMKKSIIYIASMCLGSMIFTSCDLEVHPTDRYDQETFWYGRKTANAGLVGCYATLRDQYLYGNASILWEEAASPNAFNYDNQVGWNSIALGTQTP